MKQLFNYVSVTIIAFLAFVACSSVGPATSESELESYLVSDPDLIDGNPVCTTSKNQIELGYTYGFKPNVNGDETAAGTFNDVLGVSGLTVSWSYLAGTNSTIQWSATLNGTPFGIDAVIVKASNAAHVYKYDPEATSDSGLVTPVNASGGNAAVSHVEFCFDFEVVVSKTAETSFTRTYDWGINKIADQTELVLSGDQIFNVNYTVEAFVESKTDSDWAVSGDITIYNPDPNFVATIESVTDTISDGIDASVNCPDWSIPAGGSINCSYESTPLPDGTNRINTATVETSGSVGGGSGTADVIFGEPSTKVNDCVDVEDSLKGPLGQACENESPKEFNYSLSFGKNTLADILLACGEQEVTNIAALNTGQEDSVILHVTIHCDDSAGCTLTQGYWKTHSQTGPAPYDDAWLNLGLLEEDTMFYLSNQTWYEVFWTPPQGNAYYNLAHQFEAATLNVLNGASEPAAVSTALVNAEALFNNYTPEQIAALKGKNGKALRQQFISLASTLDQYNNGLIGPGHCSE